MVNIAINGFGRIGRMVFRAGLQQGDVKFVALNDLTDTKTLAHLLKYDSTHGKFPGIVSYDDDNLYIDNNKIPVYKEKDPSNLPWKKHGVDVVVESTGLFTERDKAALHLKAGAKKVVISAPAKGDVFTVVKGVNEHSYKGEEVVSNASCTTNCLAPVVKVLDDNFGVENGFMTTVHAYTADQRVVDGPHKDLRRARAAAQNIVPTTTGAAKAVTKTLPHLEGKLDGSAIRVPVVDGSITDFTCNLKRDTSVEELNKLFENVSKNELKGILDYTYEPIVSTDIIGNSASSIVDGQSTMVKGRTVKIVAWYDNEWGYSNRVIDVVKDIV